MFSRLIHDVAFIRTSFLFNGWTIFHCVEIPHFVYPLIRWKTLGASLVAQTVKNLPAMWETRFDPGSGRSPGEGNGYPLQYSCLENSMDRGAWQATVHVVAKSQTHLATNARFHLGCFHLLFDFFLAAPRGMLDLSSLTRDQTCTPAVEARSPNQSHSREFLFFFFFYSGVISHRPPLLAEPGSVYIYIFFFSK